MTEWKKREGEMIMGRSKRVGRYLEQVTTETEREKRRKKELEHKKELKDNLLRLSENPIQLEEPQHLVYLGVEFDCHNMVELMVKLGVRDESLVGFLTIKNRVHVFPRTANGLDKLLNGEIENDPAAKQYLKDITEELPEEREERRESRARTFLGWLVDDHRYELNY